MTKVIIFDLGGVLVPEKGDYIAEQISEMLGISLEEFKENVAELKGRTSTGEITLLKMYQELVAKLGSDVSGQKLFNIHMRLYVETSVDRDHRILELVEKLKKNYKVVCLTNTEREIADFNKERGLFDLFEESYISPDMGFKKPDKNIYEKTLESLDVPARDTLFIDNDSSYIEGSESVGIPSILFIGYDELIRELINRKIEF